MRNNMNPRSKDKIAESLSKTYNKLSSLEISDEISEWSRAGIFDCKKSVGEALHEICKTINTEDFVYSTCKLDPKFFIENFVKLRTVHGEFVKFTMNDIQREMLNGFSKNDKCFVKRPRQCGSTVLIAAYILWCSLFLENESIVYCSPTSSSLEDFSRMIKNMYDYLPDYLKLNVTRNCRDFMEFSNGNTILFKSATARPDGFRGRSLTRAFLDDYRFYRNFNEMLLTITPCFREKPKLYFVSCKNKWFTGTVPACDWVGSFTVTDDKSKDIKWAVSTIKNIGIENFEEEYM